jgi:hypothetical protein
VGDDCCASKKVAQRAANYYTFVHYLCTFFAAGRKAWRGADLALKNAGSAGFAATGNASHLAMCGESRSYSQVG